MNQEEESYAEITKKLKLKDDVLAKIIESATDIPTPSLEIDIYRALLNSIVSQQLSVRVADVIWNRFLGLFGSGYPHAEELVNMDVATLRSAGLSRQKLGYMQNIGQFSIENDLSLAYLSDLTDEEIITYLTQIKGVGKWTVQMILMFPMDRPDVFPVDDLGVQTKMKQWYALDLEKGALKKKLNQIAKEWKPYRSLASKYLWKSEIN